MSTVILSFYKDERRSLKIIHPLHCDLVNMEIYSQGCLNQEEIGTKKTHPAKNDYIFI